MHFSLEKKRRTSLLNASQKQKRLRKVQIGLGLFACIVLITVLAWPYLKEEGIFLSTKKASQIGILEKDFDFKKKQLVNPRFEGEDDYKSLFPEIYRQNYNFSCGIIKELLDAFNFYLNV